VLRGVRFALRKCNFISSKLAFRVEFYYYLYRAVKYTKSRFAAKNAPRELNIAGGTLVLRSKNTKISRSRDLAAQEMSTTVRSFANRDDAPLREESLRNRIDQLNIISGEWLE